MLSAPLVVGFTKRGSTALRSHNLRYISTGLTLVGAVTAGLSLELQHGQGTSVLLLSAMAILSGIIFLYQNKLQVFVVQTLITGWSVMLAIALLVTRNFNSLGDMASGLLVAGMLIPGCFALYYALPIRRR